MGLQLVVGGAYSGKRNIIRKQYDDLTWHSAYDKRPIMNWKSSFHSSSAIVLEGWEEWIKHELETYADLEKVKTIFFNIIDEFSELEKKYDKKIILIMLEMGRGIVPLNEEDRNLRDISGWILQYATKKAETVQYCWHGLYKTIK
jgi:adenosylcobinamide kinase/adenosylcobinamide-phosphate guanylyltransferase